MKQRIDRRAEVTKIGEKNKVIFHILSEHRFFLRIPSTASIMKCQKARGLERVSQRCRSLPRDEKSLSTQEGDRFPDGRELILQNFGKALSALSVVLKAQGIRKPVCEKHV